MDTSLAKAYAAWLPFLEAGLVYLEKEDPASSILPLTEAIRISASYHPLFHFWESALNLELAQLYEDTELHQHHLQRALFLHHDNETALAIKTSKSHIVPYPVYVLCAPLCISHGKIADYWQQAKYERSTAYYLEAIALCDETHKYYHQLAALPWLARAKAFLALGERELAQNDIRRGKNLDRTHPEWGALEACIHPSDIS